MNLRIVLYGFNRIRPLIRFACLIVFAALLSCRPEDSSQSVATLDMPNIVLISLDTTRSDHCSVYGYDRDTTPNLRRLAEEGICFDAAYSPTSSTGPTHASLFTSLYPMEHRVIKNGAVLEDRFTTLAERLSGRGYQTAGFISSFVLHEKFGFAQGFELYDADFDPATAKIPSTYWEGHRVPKGFDRPADETTRRAVAWLDTERNSSRPFFMFLHYIDPHAPYDPPEPHKSRFRPRNPKPSALEDLIGRYDGDIAFADEQIGVFLDALEERGQRENTIVIVVGDHGEGLMQHGFMEHGVHVYEEYVRVPLLLRWPGNVPAGMRVAAPVELLDVAPTLFELLGMNVAPSSFKGRGLAAVVRGEKPYLEENRPIFLFRRHYEGGSIPDIEGELYAVRSGPWKYLYGPEEHREELFHLENDPQERVNLVDAHADIAADLRVRLDAWREANSPDSFSMPAISDEDREALEALGYIE